MTARAVRVRWPKLPMVTKKQLRVLRQIEYYRETWGTTASISDDVSADQLIALGLVDVNPYGRAHRHYLPSGWLVTTLGHDVLEAHGLRLFHPPKEEQSA